MENTLIRLVECWQLSQPPHLRHLAIVRDTVFVRRMTHYIYYSARNFQRLADAGEVTWEAVEYVPKGGRADPAHVPPVDAAPNLDPYGLPQLMPANLLHKNGNATLLECTMAGRPDDYFLSSSDATAVRLEDGTYGKFWTLDPALTLTPISPRPWDYPYPTWNAAVCASSGAP